MTEHYTDPTNTPIYLHEQGWERAEVEEFTLWIGQYEGDTTEMKGALRRTAGGDLKFYVRDPPEEFIKAAHDGGCLVTYSDPLCRDVEDLQLVHFASGRDPNSFGDGIRLIESYLE
jgi:hypothetical protein